MKIIKLLLFRNTKFLFIVSVFFLNLIKIILNDEPAPAEPCETCIFNNNKCSPPEGQTCSCDNFRTHLSDTQCYDCNSALGQSKTKPYYINDGVICESKDSCDNYLAIENNECVDDCGEWYIIETKIEEVVYSRCTRSCPSGYYNYRTKMCVDECKGDTDRIITSKNACIELCPSSEKYLYIHTEKINEKTITKKFCVSNCPEHAKYIYLYNNEFEEDECRTECLEGDFYEINSETNNYECKSSCNKKEFIDSSENIYQCSNIDKSETEPSVDSYDCPPSFPYQYKNSCLRDCKDTQIDFFQNKKTYSLIIKINDEGAEQIKRFCSEDCSESPNEKKFYDSSTSSCHESCSETPDKFYLGNECKKTCEGYYQYHMEDGKCVHECSDENTDEPVRKYYLLKEEKACYETCPKESKYKYINLDYNECTTCNKPQNPQLIEYGEGYIFEEEEENEKPKIFYCYSTPKMKRTEGDESEPFTYYYHRYEDNILINSCEENIDDYKYYIGEETIDNEEEKFICYKSCKDIPGDYVFEYGNQCYKSIDDTFPKNFYIESGITHYLDDSNIKICSDKGYFYKRKIEDTDNDENNDVYQCVQNCDEDEYIIPYSIDSNMNIIFGQCLKECPDNQENEFFFSETEKICRSHCLYKQIYEISGETSTLKTINGIGNCVTECPPNYDYESSDGNCYNKCPSKYYLTEDGKKKCIDDCKSINKYSFNDENENKCFDKCQRDGDNNFYYYNDNNICLDSCLSNDEGSSKFFALEAIDSPQPCIRECPKGHEYYYENKKICLEDCGDGYHKDAKSKICVEFCEINQEEEDQPAIPYIINGNICSNPDKKCTREQPFYISMSITSKTIYICTSNCTKEAASYQYYKNMTEDGDENQIYECLPTCSGEFNKIYGKECVKECPEGFYEENNICKLECSNSYKYSKESHKCVPNCNEGEYITSNRECVQKCPFGENFIGSGNQCKSKCDPIIDGENYEQFNENNEQSNEENEADEYKIYKCKNKCDDYQGGENTNYLLYGKECVSQCPQNTYKSPDNICYSHCLQSEKYPYTKNDECSISCQGNEPKIYYQENKICTDTCEGLNNIINDKDNSCVSKCDITSTYKYLKKIPTEDGIYHCTDTCSKYTYDNFICYDGEYCPPTYNYIIGSECHEKCLGNQFANPINDNKEYKCESNCNSQTYFLYYENEKICLNNCKTGYNIENTNVCIKSCNDIKIENENLHYYSYHPEEDNPLIKIDTCVTECPTDKPYKDIDYSCSDKCKFSGYNYYNPLDNICTNKCEGVYNKIVEENGQFKCLSECPEKTYLNESGVCVDSCKENSKGGYYYFSKKEKKCLKNCGLLEFMNEYECVPSCPDGKNYIIDQKCDVSCSVNKKYYIGNFEHGETDLNNYCYIDCPEEYPFFEKIEEGTGDSLKQTGKCIGSCSGYYISNKDPSIIAKQCIGNCIDINYNYYVEYNITHKECFDICPSDKKYYIPIEAGTSQTEPIKCYSECPPTHPYHKRNSYECIKECDDTSNYATYNEKQCISKCDIGNFWIKEKTPTDKDITLCVSDCSLVDNARFYTPERECVSNCNENKFLIGNTAKKICECMKLFYYDEDGIMQCFDNSISKCGAEDTTTKDYPIQINNSNQCIKNCFGVLSPSEKVCYINGEECPKNSQKGIYNGKIKCECKYKFYFDNDDDKICLDENEQCPDEYKYFVPDENKCLSSCDLLDNNIYKIVFDNKCLTLCPTGMTKTEDEKSCKCTKYWYKTSENKYICLKDNENCNNNFPYLIEETNECVQKCNKTGYEIYYGNKCISSCENNMIKVKVETKNPLFQIASETCRCQNAWTEGYCSSNSDETCESDYFKNLNLNYQVKATKECLQKCPDYYQFYFNKECFESCEKAKSEFGYNVKRESNNSNKCICDSNWRIDEKGSMECIEKCDENNEIEIEDTKQCVIKPDSEDNLDNFKCPYTSPYFYNNKCYSKCPDGTTIDNIKGNSCKCDSNKFWFKQDSGLITCLSNKCPYNTFPYYINVTKECVKTKEQCAENNYNKIFNYACYSQCPYLTIDNENNCECDQKKYFWYRYKDKDDLREYLVCNLENCTEDRPFYINGTNECISRCGDLALYEYSKICYSECPLFTQKNKNDYICEFSTESNNLQELVGNVTNRIVDIYPDLPNGGLVINNEEASLQIYGLNRDNYNNTDAIIRINLAYIDLSGCIDKIYESNNMESKDDIVVVKLDLKSKNKKLVVNPVEYEFINSKNGKILDATVCEKNQVVISYPLTYMLNSQKKRNLQDEQEPESEDEEEKEEDIQKKDIMDKFNKGKKLNDQDKSIDTFNFNSSIYYDICTPLEIDGKDLVLENRIQSLFPNYSFCESICTYDYTDFSGERIYCNCSIKSGIDVSRPHGVKIYQFSKNELEDNQKGPTNLPILKCVSKAKIGGNAAFYYCIVFIIIEIILLLLVIFYGISSLANKIRKKAINNNGNKDEDKKSIEYNVSENDKINGNKLDKDIKYNMNTNSNTKRKMNANEIKINANPPRNGVVDTDEDEDEKGEKEVNINIKKNKGKKININIDEKNKFDIFSNPNDVDNEIEHNIEIEKYLQNNEIESKKGFFQSMKEEEKLLTAKYDLSLKNDKFDWVTIVLTSIFDKIYIIKILLLSGKFDIIPLMFSLYLLCHMLLLTFVTFFYDIKTIKNIWIKENYPDTNYYLSYGFLANIIVWLIYKMFCCLLDNKHKVKKLNNTNGEKKEEKFKKIIYKIKRNMIIYMVLQFLIMLFCSFYLITFCGIYVGTKKNIFESYGIAFIEIIIIKIVYGFILGILRKVSLIKEISLLYNITLILNKYIS